MSLRRQRHERQTCRRRRESTRRFDRIGLLAVALCFAIAACAPRPDCATGTRCLERCVDPSTDPMNCGACGHACAASEICAAGVCQVFSLPCDGGRCATRCGDATCGSGEVCDAQNNTCVCAFGTHHCGGACVRDDSPVTCGTRCSPCPTLENTEATCIAGVCGVQCAPGFHPCAASCVPDTSIDACGASCTHCPGGGSPRFVPACIDGVCRTVCAPGFHICKKFAGCVAEDVDSCGPDCTHCPAVGDNAFRTCGHGVCGSVCAPGTVRCSTGCETETAARCGSDCVSCPVPQNADALCIAGSCTSACKPGFHSCGNQCVPENDSSCGPTCASCGSTAHGAIHCAASTCKPFCDPGHFPCPSGCCLATGLFATRDATCLVMSDGNARCWGASPSAGLGNADEPYSTTPVFLSVLDAGITELDFGSGEFTCALLTDARVACWNAVASASLCRGANAGTAPAEVPNLSPSLHLASQYTPCAIRLDGGFDCVGQSACNAVSAGLAGAAVQAAGAAGHVCAVLSTGDVQCWGTNEAGESGASIGNAFVPPTVVTGFDAGIVRVAVGRRASCALDTAGRTWCWGVDFISLRSGGPLTMSEIAAVKPFVSDGLDLCLGGAHVCVAARDGGVRCWGERDHGQLGDAFDSGYGPSWVIGLDAGAKSIACGEQHTCALLVDGVVRCWGDNGGAQIGNGTTTLAPTAVDVSNR